MWTKENRARYDRSRLRYESDLTDAEWAEVKPLIPPAKPGGNKRTVEIRQVLNGLMYILSTGCQWRAIPKELPPRSTVHDYLERWTWDGTLERLHHALYADERRRAGGCEERREGAHQECVGEPAAPAHRRSPRTRLRISTRSRLQRLSSPPIRTGPS